MSLIVAKNLVKEYGKSDAVVTAIRDISFEIESGEFIGIMGESGAGKSTLLSVMGAMNAPTSGNFLVDDIDVYSLGQEKRADFRREFIGFVFQNFHLIPYLTVGENVMLPLSIVKGGKKEKRASVEEALKSVGLADKINRLPGQLSGGEKERVAIARGIVNDPPFLLADEPTGNLDSQTKGEIMKLFQTLNKGGMTVIIVTHSHECAAYTQRILQVSDGKLVKEQ